MRGPHAVTRHLGRFPQPGEREGGVGEGSEEGKVGGDGDGLSQGLGGVERVG